MWRISQENVQPSCRKPKFMYIQRQTQSQLMFTSSLAVAITWWEGVSFFSVRVAHIKDYKGETHHLV